MPRNSTSAAARHRSAGMLRKHGAAGSGKSAAAHRARRVGGTTGPCGHGGAKLPSCGAAHAGVRRAGRGHEYFGRAHVCRRRIAPARCCSRKPSCAKEMPRARWRCSSPSPQLKKTPLFSRFSAKRFCAPAGWTRAGSFPGLLHAKAGRFVKVIRIGRRLHPRWTGCRKRPRSGADQRDDARAPQAKWNSSRNMDRLAATFPAVAAVWRKWWRALRRIESRNEIFRRAGAAVRFVSGRRAG